MPKNPRSGRPYRRAVANLKARAAVQQCWRCGKTLYADAPKGHPDAITLGHLIALVDGGSVLDPKNHEPECGHCNSVDGGRRGAARRAGTPSNVTSYRNPAW